jgi:hypothetical protein
MRYYIAFFDGIMVEKVEEIGLIDRDYLMSVDLSYLVVGGTRELWSEMEPIEIGLTKPTSRAA